MARKRTGTVIKTKSGLWQAVLTLQDGSRKRLPPFPKGTSKAMAQDKAAFYAEQAIQKGTRKAAPKPTNIDRSELGRYLDRLFEFRTERGRRRQSTERARLRNHVEPLLAERNVFRIQDVDSDDCRVLVESLDDKAQAGEITGATAGKVWAIFKLVCKESFSSKRAEFRLRKDDPTVGVQGPDKGSKKDKQWLFPEELAQLLRCPMVPRRWRRLYAVTTYLALRAGEAAALQCEDIDLARGRVRISRSRDRETGEVGPTKTEDTRVLDLRSGPDAILPLLRAMVKEAGGSGLLLKLPPIEDLADTLRQHIKRAGITRPELYDSTDQSLPLWFHDLRATGISWLAMLPEWTSFDIRDFAGHSELKTTDRYVRRGRKARDVTDAPFGPIPRDLIEGLSITAIDHHAPSIANPACFLLDNSVPDGIRTRVTALKGPCPGPG